MVQNGGLLHISLDIMNVSNSILWPVLGQSILTKSYHFRWVAVKLCIYTGL